MMTVELWSVCDWVLHTQFIVCVTLYESDHLILHVRLANSSNLTPHFRTESSLYLSTIWNTHRSREDVVETDQNSGDCYF
jgi:hypothetical protein